MDILKQHIKQTFNLFKENPYISLISVLGTALAITTLMGFYIGNQSHVMDLTPENNRHRTLYVKWVGVRDKEKGNVTMNAFLSLNTIKECFQTLKTPEAIVVTSPLQPRLVSIPKSGHPKRAYILFTNDVFWRVFDFSILAGTPYTKEEFDAGIKKIVLGKQLATNLFGSPDEAVGKEMQLSYTTYTVCAVADDIFPMADFTFAQAWVPYTSANLPVSGDAAGVTGRYQCQILARSSADFPAIRREVEEQTKRYNTTLPDCYVDFYRQPDNRRVEGWRFGAGYPQVREHYITLFITFLVMLIIPAINLSGFIMARMKRRVVELGIRRSFGSTRVGLIMQVLWENMFYSIVGGIIGLFTSYAAMYAERDFVFNSTNHFGLDIKATAPMEIFFNVPTFLAAFLFCLALNLLSALIPAWRATSVPIVNSLKNE